MNTAMARRLALGDRVICVGKDNCQPSGTGTIIRITAHRVEVLWRGHEYNNSEEAAGILAQTSPRALRQLRFSRPPPQERAGLQALASPAQEPGEKR
jgi:hypothetical protein